MMIPLYSIIVASVIIIFSLLIVIFRCRSKYDLLNYQNSENLLKIENLSEEVNRLNKKLEYYYETNIDLEKHISAKTVRIESLESQLESMMEQHVAISEIGKASSEVFENIGRKILEENREKFNKIATSQINTSLSPVEKTFVEFKQNLDNLRKEQIEYNSTLKEQISHVTQKADNLGHILKVDKKFQGSWGEYQLSRLLQLAGLTEGIDYETEKYVDDHNKDRVDVILYLPENKHILIDSKVSFVAYEKYLEADNKHDTESQKKYLEEFIKNITNQIQKLSDKNYHSSRKYPSVSYTLMFVPIETAYILAFSQGNLQELAWQSNIIPVAPSNLYPTLKTISSIIALEKKQNHAFEIAQLAEKMLDRLNTVYEDISSIEKGFNTIGQSFQKIKNSLQDGRGTILSNANKMISLGQLKTKLSSVTRDFKADIEVEASENILDLKLEMQEIKNNQDIEDD